MRKELLKLADANRKIGEYESSLNRLNNEIQRLNHVLKVKVDENNEYEANLRSAQT